MCFDDLRQIRLSTGSVSTREKDPSRSYRWWSHRRSRCVGHNFILALAILSEEETSCGYLGPPEKRDQSTLNRSARQSTRSAHSIASTVFTRASNVIQIAYIPGVTVRSPPESPGLIPPVPSLPGTASNASSRRWSNTFSCQEI